MPEGACEMRINGGLGRTLRFCETPPRTFPARFAISQSVHHESVSLWGFTPILNWTLPILG